MNLLTGQKGVTLISLVITIIVMLILAIVVFSLPVLSDKIFNKANKAVVVTNNEIQNELETLVELDETLKYYDDSLFKCVATESREGYRSYYF